MPTTLEDLPCKILHNFEWESKNVHVHAHLLAESNTLVNVTYNKQYKIIVKIFSLGF